MRDDENVVVFCNSNTLKSVKLPKEVAVVTELLDDDTVIVVSAEEFVNWLFEKNAEAEE